MTLEFILYYWLWCFFMTSNCCCYKRKILNMFNVACCMYAWVIVPHIAMSCSWFVCPRKCLLLQLYPSVWPTNNKAYLWSSCFTQMPTIYAALCLLESTVQLTESWVLFPCIIPFFRKKGLMPMHWAFALLH